jgi:hypothetical protein
MKTLSALALAAALAVSATAAQAKIDVEQVYASAQPNGLPDYSAAVWNCDQEEITTDLGDMIANANRAFPSTLLYVKNVSETGRSKDELRCRLTAVTTKGTLNGVFIFHNQDGHILVGWRNGAKK